MSSNNSDVFNSPTKENLDPNVTPPRSPLKSIRTGSPSQNKSKSMWDSGDPNRNPPPLPVSPQMIRINPNKNKPASPSSVGKLQFATIDNSEVEHQLKRIIDAQANLRSIVVGVDTSVKQTQLDLENLVERSSNNNSHLKDLVSNVKASVSGDQPTLSEEKVKAIIKEALNSINEHTRSFDAAQKDIVAKIDSLKVKLGEPNESYTNLLQEINASVSEMAQEINSIKSSHGEHSQLLTSLDSKFKSRDIDTGKLHSSLEGSNKSVSEHLTKIESIIADLGLQNFYEKSLEKHESILNKLDSNSKDSLDKDISEIKSLNENFTKEIQESISKAQDGHTNRLAEITTLVTALQSKLAGSEENQDKVVNALSENHTTISTQLSEEIEKLKSALNESSERFDTSSASHKEDILKKLDELSLSLVDLHTKLETKTEDKSVLKDLENKDLEIQLKDKEIVELKSQLEEAQKKIKIEEDIADITYRKAKLESRYEQLNETYLKRFQEFKELSGDYDSLQQKITNINIEKMKTIHGAAAFSRISYDQSPTQQTETPRKNVLSTRVLSTNSYLNSNQLNVTPKSKKKYEFESTVEFEEKENI